MAAKKPQTLRVFIGCPGDMAPEREALLGMERELDRQGCPVKFTFWKEATPGGGSPQKNIFEEFRKEDWDIFLCLLWTRIGVPSGFVDPLDQRPLTGTEAEFVAAYDLWKASGGERPQLLLYRCKRDLPNDVDLEQFGGVRRFLQSIETGQPRETFSQDFTTLESLTKRFAGDLTAARKRLAAAKPKPTTKPARGSKRRAEPIDWATAENAYRDHLIARHRIVTFYSAEIRQPVEMELEKVFIKLLAKRRESRLFNDVPVLVDFGISRADLRSAAKEWVADDLTQRLRHRDVELLNIIGHHRDISPSEVTLINPFGAEYHSQPVTLPELLDQGQHLALTGSPGSGKSTLLQYLTLSFASRRQQERLEIAQEHLPVFIRLRDFHRWAEGQRHAHKLDTLHPDHFTEYLAHAWSQDKSAPVLPDGFFPRLFTLPSLVVFFDGLDEIAVPRQRRAIATLVSAAIDAWPQVRTVTTSRPKAWENEGRQTFGSRVREAEICDLDDQQIDDFIRHWYRAVKIASHQGDTAVARADADKAAADLIAAIGPFRQSKLTATPLILSNLAMVHSRGAGLPRERGRLYFECTEFMLGYWDELHSRDHDSEIQEVSGYDTATKRQLIEPVAHWIHQLGSAQIDPQHDDIVEQFALSFQSVLNEPEPAARRHARAFVRLIVERGGLLQESEAGQFRFAHLTFQEYLAACHIAHGKEPFTQVADKLHDPWWREVILLAGSELSRQRSYRAKEETAAWLNGILNADTWAEKYLHRDLQLAALCSVDMAESGLPAKVIDDIARRLIDAVTGPNRQELEAFIRKLPLAPLIRAIASQLPRDTSQYDRVANENMVAIASLLPSGVCDDSLIEKLSKLSQSHEYFLAESAAYLCLLHGPKTLRLANLATLRQNQAHESFFIDEERISSIFALNDDAVTENLLSSYREKMTSNRAAPNFLVRFGTPADKEAAIAHVINSLRDSDPRKSAKAVREFHHLSERAVTPEMIAALGSLVRKDTGLDTGPSAFVYTEFAEKYPTSVDATILEDLAAELRLSAVSNSAILTSVRFVLKHGSETARAQARVRIYATLDEAVQQHTPSNGVWQLIQFLLVHDAQVDRRRVAKIVESLMGSDATASELPWLFQCIAELREAAWKHPLLIARLSAATRLANHEAADGLFALSSLLAYRPKTSPIPEASIPNLASRTIAFMEASPAHTIFFRALSAIRALSAYPELRTHFDPKPRKQRATTSKPRRKTAPKRR